MRKIIAAINMTLDGVFDHTAVNPDKAIHQHYADLIGNSGVLLYGRITYGLMEYWKELARNPSGEKMMDDFALVIDQAPKLIFSRILKILDWESASLAARSLEDEVRSLQQQPGKDILIGSRSLIIALLQLGLIDQLQLCIHPVLAGEGHPLFESLKERTSLKLVNTKTFDSGAVILYYEPENPAQRH